MLKRFIIAILLIPTTLVGIYFIAQFAQPNPEDINDPKIAMRIGEKYASRKYPLYSGLRAQPYFERARELGEKAASAYLAHIYYISLPVEEACLTTLAFAEEAQDSREAGRASYFQGLVYYRAKCSLNDIDKAETYFLRSVEQGSTLAYGELSTIYESDKVDLVKAKYWTDLMLEDTKKLYATIGTMNKIRNYSEEIFIWYLRLFDGAK